MIRDVFVGLAKQYIPVLLNSLCTAICVFLSGCRLIADHISIDVEYPATYHSMTNTAHN